ncbi:MAG: gamma-glutamyl-gamma-aminobutyrate hydrolase family protein [Steroidobacteraceae bacterium]
MNRRRPLIGIPADRRLLEPHPFHCVGEKYISAVADAAGGMPLLIPVLATPLPPAQVLPGLDGLFLPGSPSNVEPQHYGDGPSKPGTLHDPHRDRTSLPLINAAIEAGVPLLAVCRGLQEVNVARGGTLWQHVEEQPQYHDHREDKTQPLEVQYGPAHDVLLESGGLLRRLAGRERVTVNSLHAQGVKQLAGGLAVEARADDGLIEAFSVIGAPAFAVAVQWHPEWQVMQNDFSKALFAAFGDAARERAETR